VEPAAESTDTAGKDVEPAAESTDTAGKDAEPAAESTDTAEKDMDPAAELTDTAEKEVEPAAESTDTAGKAAEPVAESTNTAEKDMEPAAESTDTAEKEVDTRTYAWVAEELSGAKTECAEVKKRVDALETELMRLPKPRTQKVVRNELFAVLGYVEMKQWQEKWLGWNVCPRTITSPIKYFLDCSQMLCYLSMEIPLSKTFIHG
jgi:hypothetical protein